MFKQKKQRGSLILTLGVVVGIGGTVLVALSPLAEKALEKNKETLNKAYEAAADPFNKDGPTNEEIQESRDTITMVGKAALAGASIINSATNVNPGENVNDALKVGISVISDSAIGYAGGEGTNPAPTESNPMPSDVPTRSACSSRTLSHCVTRTSCTTAGGHWSSSNTCKKTLTNDGRYTGIAITTVDEGFCIDTMSLEAVVLGSTISGPETTGTVSGNRVSGIGPYDIKFTGTIGNGKMSGTWSKGACAGTFRLIRD